MFELNKKIADEIMSFDGEVRGVVFKTDEKFIAIKGGEEKVKEIEDEIKSLGYSIDYANINTMNFYPIGLRILSLLTISKVFKMEEKDVKEMGSFAPKFSLLIKFFIQYFISIKKTLSQVSQMWEKHYTKGKITPIKINEKEKKVSIKLEGLDVHPIFYIYLAGYFSRITETIVKSPVQVEETEDSFENEKYHIFSLKW